MLTIGRLAQSTGVNIETIRYYERIALMPAPRRTEGGHRLYDDHARRRLAFIRRGRDIGFTLEQVRELLHLSQDEGQPCGSVFKVASMHLENVRSKIRDLTRLEAVLADAVGRCEPQTIGPHCAVLEMLAE